MNPVRMFAVVVLCAIALYSGPSASAGMLVAPPPGTDPSLPSIVGQTLRTMRGLGVPERLLEQLEARADVTSESDIYAFPARDLDGDGSPEIIEWEITYALSFGTGGQTDPLGPAEEFRTVITIRSGDNGKRLWKKKFDDFVFPVDTIVADGRPGIVAIGGLFSFFGSSGERHVDFHSLKGKSGKRLWFRSFSAVAAGDYFTHVAEDAPLALSFAQALPGKPVDIVLTLGTEVSTLLASSVTSRVVVVDGASGSETAHINLDVGVDWMPYATAVSDLDGDGLQDYVVVNNPGIDLGGPQEPPSVGGTLYARRGTDGSQIWTTSGLNLYDFAWATRLPDVVGEKTGEVALLTPNDPNWREFAVYLFDGTTGIQRWKKLGFGVMVPGDVNQDGRPDLLMGDAWFNFEKHKAGFKISVFQGTGRRIYRKSYRWSFDGLPCPKGLCSGGYGYGWGSGGDIQPDLLKETYIYMQVQQDPGEAQTRTILADGRDGKVLSIGEGETYPAGDAIDGAGDDFFKIKTKGGISVVEILDGRTDKQLLRTVIQRKNGLLPRSAYAFGTTFRLPGDRCADIVVNMWSGEGSYYAILDGGSGKPLWSRWNGAKKARPAVTTHTDRNAVC